MPGDYLDQTIGQLAAELVKLRIVKVVTAPIPAVGADINTPVTSGVIWELLSFKGVLTTSAAVANRQPSLVIADQDGVATQRYSPSGSLTAGVGWLVQFAAGLGMSSAIGPQEASLPTPPIVVLSGWSIRTLTGSIDVGDQWSSVFLTVREWDETSLMQEIPEVVERLNAYVGR